MNQNKKSLCKKCQSERVAYVKINSKLSYCCCKTCGHCDLNVASYAIAFDSAQKQYFSENLQTLTGFSENQVYKANKNKLYIVRRFLKSKSKVIEVGPGMGSFAGLLFGQGHQVTLIEHSHELVCLLREKGNYTVHEGEFENTLTENAEYDLFVSLHVIEHVVDPFKHLSRAFDIIKPGGYALIATPNAKSWQQRLFTLLSPNFDSAHLRVYSLDSLKRECNRSGWNVIAQHTPDPVTGWLRVITKIIRKLRKEDEELTAGKYSAQVSKKLSYFIAFFGFITLPLRTFQAMLYGGNEIVLVCQKPK